MAEKADVKAEKNEKQTDLQTLVVEASKAGQKCDVAFRKSNRGCSLHDWRIAWRRFVIVPAEQVKLDSLLKDGKIDKAEHEKRSKKLKA